MPKYIPTTEDIYTTRSCKWCGAEVYDEDSEFCSENCKQNMQFYEEDIELLLIDDFDWEEDFNNQTKIC